MNANKHEFGNTAEAAEQQRRNQNLFLLWINAEERGSIPIYH
jgi:hypothetical protein